MGVFSFGWAPGAPGGGRLLASCRGSFSCCWALPGTFLPRRGRSWGLVQVPPWKGPGLGAADTPLAGPSLAPLDLPVLSLLDRWVRPFSPRTLSDRFVLRPSRGGLLSTCWGFLPARPPLEVPPRFRCYSPSFLKAPIFPKGSFLSASFHVPYYQVPSPRCLPFLGLFGMARSSRRPCRRSMVSHLLLLHSLRLLARHGRAGRRCGS